MKMVLTAVVMVVLMTYGVGGAPCCGPKQWAGEVRRVTMDTRLSHSDDIQEWHWVSYDLDRQKVAVITFDPRPGKSDLYRRELMDFGKGMHYVTPDEVKCTSSRLKGSMPQLCVPPSGGNITLDFRQFFGVFPDPGSHISDQPVPSTPEFHRLLPMTPDRHGRSHSSPGDDSMGVYAETIYYETDDVVGYVTVASMTCSFMNEMKFTTNDDGSPVWQHTQWNNLTLTVDPDNFQMPKSCFNSTGSSPSHRHSGGSGQIVNILDLL